MRVSRHTVGQAVGLLGCIAALLLYSGWQLAHRGAYQYSTAIYPFDDADEWRYTACSRLVEHGYALFHQVFSAQPPVLFLSLAGSMRLFGDSIDGARWSMILFGLLALVSTAWITWTLAGPVAGGASALLLTISPGFLVYSRAVEAEVPMMALSTLSLAVLQHWAKRTATVTVDAASDRGPSPPRAENEPSQWPTLVLPPLAGLVLAAAILTKLFAVEGIVPALWLIVSASARRWRVRTLALFGAAVVIPVAIEMTLVFPSQQWAQVVTMHSKASSLVLLGAPSPLTVLRDFFGLDPGLALLALGGLCVLAALSVREDLVFLLLWLGGSLVMLLFFRPLFPHHPIILLSSMAVSGGIAATILTEQVHSRRWLAALPLAAVAFLYLLLLPRAVRADRHALYAGVSPSRTTLARFIGGRTTERDMVVVDDLALADLAHRLVPPGLCDPSNVRLRAGYLTAGDTVTETRTYDARLVLPSFGIYVQLPEYLAWVKAHYRSIDAPFDLRAYLSKAR